MTITVLLVDDHRAVRQRIRLLQQVNSEIEVIGQAANEDDAVTEACLNHPDISFPDLLLPVCRGIAATAPIHPEFAQTEIVVLTSLHEYAGAIATMRDRVTSSTQSAIRVTRLGLLPAGILDGPKPQSTNAQR